MGDGLCPDILDLNRQLTVSVRAVTWLTTSTFKIRVRVQSVRRTSMIFFFFLLIAACKVEFNHSISRTPS